MAQQLHDFAYFLLAAMACYGVLLHGIAAMHQVQNRRDELELVRASRQAAGERRGEGARS